MLCFSLGYVKWSNVKSLLEGSATLLASVRSAVPATDVCACMLYRVYGLQRPNDVVQHYSGRYLMRASLCDLIALGDDTRASEERHDCAG